MSGREGGLASHASEARELLDMLRRQGEDDEEVLLTAVEGETSLTEAVSEAVRHILEIEAHVAALDLRAAQIGARKERLVGRVERIKQAVLAALEMTGLPNMPTPEGTVYLGQGKAGVLITAEGKEPPADAPARFVSVQVKRTWDKKAIGDALRAGEALDFAVLQNGAPFIAIRKG